MTIFQWDKNKEMINIRKHSISFDTAMRVFADEYAVSEQDRFENGEYRWQTLGMVNGHLILLVAHTTKFEDSDEVIRIISARKATKQEQRKYERNRHL